MTPFAIFAADLHLAQRTRASFPTMCGDAYFGLHQLVDLANKLHLPLVFAGDIFDKPMVDSQTLQVYIDELSRLNSGLYVYAIEGDHELADPRWFTFSDRAVALADAPVRLWCGVTLFGVDFQRAETLPQKLRDTAASLAEIEPAFNATPDNTILVTHEGWAEMRRLGHTEGKFADVSRFKLMFAGDFHTHGVWQGQNAEGDALTVYSPGSTCMQSVSESPEKKVFIGHLSDTGEIVMVPHVLKTRPYLHMHITDERDARRALESCQTLLNFSSFVTDLPPELHTPFVYLETQIDLHEISGQLRQLAKQLHLHIVYRAPEVAAIVNDAVVARIEVQTSMVEAVRRRASAADIQADALALWQSESPADTIAAIRKRVSDDAVNQA